VENDCVCRKCDLEETAQPIECTVCGNLLPANFKGICPRCRTCVSCD